MKKTSSKTSSVEKKTAATSRTKSAAAAPKATAPAKKPVTRKTPSAVKRATPAKSKTAGKETAIIARANVGFGNRLYLRGNGPGLSWDRGVLLSCTDSDCWTWRSTDAKTPFEFKILLNDEQWSHGENWTIAPGETKDVTPRF